MKKILLCALAAAMLAGSAHAGDKMPAFVETLSIPDKPGFAINPAKGYVLLRTDVPTGLYLTRVASAEDQARYNEIRAKALAEAQAKYPKKMASWENAMKIWKAQKEAGATSSGAPPRPVEPTEESFQITPFEMLTMVSIGPLFRFAKAKGGGSTYLQELTPGEYRIYGPLTYTSAGPMGACYCMGSVKFEVRAGEITDMGAIPVLKGPVPTPPPGDSSMPIFVDNPDFLIPAPDRMPLDPRLANMPIRRAVYHPVGKLPNFFGVMLARVPSMPGVIAYDHDRIIDLTAGKAP